MKTASHSQCFGRNKSILTLTETRNPEHIHYAHTHTEIDTHAHAQTVLPFLQLAGSLSYPMYETEKEREGNGKRDKNDIHRQTDDRMNSRKRDRASQARMEPGRQSHTQT